MRIGGCQKYEGQKTPGYAVSFQDSSASVGRVSSSTKLGAKGVTRRVQCHMTRRLACPLARYIK